MRTRINPWWALGRDGGSRTSKPRFQWPAWGDRENSSRPIPWRARSAEDVLRGAEIVERTASEGARAALEGASPLAENAGKIPLARTLLERAAMSFELRAACVKASLLH